MENILEEERQEREIAKMENQTNRVENMLKESDSKDERSWFQTKKERQKEKSTHSHERALSSVIFEILKCIVHFFCLQKIYR